jgi:hypothetical protein
VANPLRVRLEQFKNVFKVLLLYSVEVKAYAREKEHDKEQKNKKSQKPAAAAQET